jgi:hypothetical protein
MTYCLNVEGFSPFLLTALTDELRLAYSVESVDGVIYCFSPDARGELSSGVSIHPEAEESTLFVEPNTTPVAFHRAVLGHIVALLADRGCEVTVAEV